MASTVLLAFLVSNFSVVFRPHHYKPGMHNIRPTGQLWPAEAFNLARTAKFSPVCVIETQLEGVKPYHFMGVFFGP